MRRGVAGGVKFESSVFINCPFDEEYLSLLRPLLFTIVFLGFNPRIASERSDAGENRIDKICQLISESKYSVHDLSRLQAEKGGEFYRLNMPFELGIDYGMRRLSVGSLQGKRFLILGEKRYDFMKALSDLSGVDIKAHKGEPDEIPRVIRSWFVETAGVRGVKSPTQLWYAFNDFASDFYSKRKAEGFSDKDLNMMPVPEYIDSIRDWISTS